jgi:hypothetical protein
MKLPDAAHFDRPWRLHELVPDFRLEDVWELPCHGDEEDFGALVAMTASQDVTRSSSRAVRVLFEIRWKLGELFGWDDAKEGPGVGEETLRTRLPADLRQSPCPEFASLPFASLYMLEDEFAAEAANRTMHGILHLGWVPDESGGFKGQLAVLVKPNGPLGAAYMAAIRPFRHLLVYPALMRQFERAWRSRARRKDASVLTRTQAGSRADLKRADI